MAATAAKLVTPTSRAPDASAIPCAAASPARIPVNPPGPVAAATKSSAPGTTPAARATRSTIGSSASACPWRNARCSAASVSAPRRIAAEQPEPAVSIASSSGFDEPRP